MEEKNVRTVIRVPYGGIRQLCGIFNRCDRYVRTVLRGDTVSGTDAERIRRAALERGGVEYERVLK
jgi:hypothetical protein